MLKLWFGLLIIGFANAGNIQSGGYGYEQLGLSTKLANRYQSILANALNLRNGYESDSSHVATSGIYLSSAPRYNSFGFNSLDLSAQPSSPLSAAIHTRRFYQVIPVQTSHEPAIPQVIEVEPTLQPVKVIFRTVSSPVLVQQIHTPGAPGHTEATHSEDEPHRVLHSVYRPIIQEVKEVIQPYRRVTQEIRPVLEEVHTLVAKGERTAAPQQALVAPTISTNSGSAHLPYDLNSLNSGIALNSPIAISESDLHLADDYSNGQSLGLEPGYSGSSAYSTSKAKKGAK